MHAAARKMEPQTVTVDSRLFGTVHVAPAAIFHFPDGLPGLEQERRFALMRTARENLYLLQSMAVRELALFLIDPFAIHPAYELDLSVDEHETLKLDPAHPEQLLALCVVTLPAGEQLPATANLRAPLVFNLHEQSAMQVVSRREDYHLTTPVDLNALKRVDD